LVNNVTQLDARSKKNLMSTTTTAQKCGCKQVSSAIIAALLGVATRGRIISAAQHK
jgi:hypothetical protein